MRSGFVWSFGLVTYSCLVGCVGTPSNDESVGKAEQAAAYVNDDPYWSSPGTLNLCFTGPETGLALRTFFMNSIAASWGAAGTGLAFNFQGICSLPIPSATMSVYMRTGAPAG